MSKSINVGSARNEMVDVGTFSIIKRGGNKYDKDDEEDIDDDYIPSDKEGFEHF